MLKSIQINTLFWQENCGCLKTIRAMAVDLENGVVRRGVGDPKSGDERG
mgnify:CR=1 FL=1